ncbi:MAG: hydrogenase maturation nickel metallochaperone HypA [Anaerolineae bacterium]
MHELGITESLLSLALEQATQAQAQRITKIEVVIGQDSGASEESIKFYFDLLTPGTIAEGATLSFERVATRFRCPRCQRLLSPAEASGGCPDCGERSLELAAGRELYLKSIDVE